MRLVKCNFVLYSGQKCNRTIILTVFGFYYNIKTKPQEDIPHKFENSALNR